MEFLIVFSFVFMKIFAFLLKFKQCGVLLKVTGLSCEMVVLLTVGKT